MPRTAPIVAAVLGVGLVLALTRSPAADVHVPAPSVAVVAADAGGAVEPARRQATRAMPERAGATASAPLVSGPPRADAAIVIEDRDALAPFAIPQDRLALAGADGALSHKSRLAMREAPALVALVASWCAPCAAELPVLRAFAEATGVRLVLVSEDDVGGPESLRAVIEDLHARAEPLSRARPALELRADPDGAWTRATAPLLAGRGEPEALPQTLLLDAAGELTMLVQGGFDASVAERMMLHLDMQLTHGACL